MKSNLQPSPVYQVAEINITYSSGIRSFERPKITSSWQAHDVFLATWEKGTIGHREQLRVLLLNRSNTVLGVYLASSGGIAGTVCDPKLVFQVALKANASSIILAYNHPSGNLTPSEADRNLTKKLVEAGKLLDLPVCDHLILTEEGVPVHGRRGADVARSNKPLGVFLFPAPGTPGGREYWC